MDSCERQSDSEQIDSMALPLVTTFCWCMGLETGAKLIGYLHLLGSLSLMVVCAQYAAMAYERVGAVEDPDDLFSVIYVVGAVMAGIAIVHVLLALTLIVSVFKRWKMGVHAWAVVMGMVTASAVLYVLGLCAFRLSAPGNSDPTSDIVLTFLEELLFKGFVGYCSLVVYSYYRKLKSEDMQSPGV
ncbi:hypothetical protein ACJJTC_016373 [Scirpophaga incertulas]